MLIIGLKFGKEIIDSDPRTRRKHLRLDINSSCVYSQFSDYLGAKISHIAARGSAINISESGMCIEGRQCIVPETPVRILLHLGKKEIQFRGITKWAVPDSGKSLWRIGINFTSSFVQARDLCKRLQNLERSGVFITA